MSCLRKKTRQENVFSAARLTLKQKITNPTGRRQNKTEQDSSRKKDPQQENWSPSNATNIKKNVSEQEGCNPNNILSKPNRKTHSRKQAYWEERLSTERIQLESVIRNPTASK
jgi:hypothetical protein